MNLQSIQLTNFRNYDIWEQEFEVRATMLVGANAVGKTNVLEAVYLLATGKSFRASKIEEMVRWGEDVGHVVGKLKTQNSELKTNEEELRVTLTRGMVQGKKVQKRRYLVNNVPRRRMDFVGNLVAVKFLPSDLELISGSPSKRREYWDDLLSQVDREYRRSLLSYSKAIVRRNKLLTLIREGKTQRSSLLFWDKLLIKEGEVLMNKRQDLVDFVNLTPALGGDLRVEYMRSVITEERLLKYKVQEVQAGYTLVGPHKDDFRVLADSEEALQASGQMQGRDLAVYGSRGEQRMAVLWLKTAELSYVESRLKMRPILLLDDIFSELDQEHERLVLGLLSRQQTIVTTTEEDARFEKLSQLKVVRLQ
jgi:DNA replication and repair protein RecF